MSGCFELQIVLTASTSSKIILGKVVFSCVHLLLNFPRLLKVYIS